MKNRYNLALCLFVLTSINLLGQGEPPNPNSTDDVSATGWVEIKGNAVLTSRTASIQSTSLGVTITFWDSVYRLESSGIHVNITPRQGGKWTYGVSTVYKDTLYVPARYFARGQGVDSSKVFKSANNGSSWRAVDGPVFSSSSLQVNTDIRMHGDTMYLMGDDELFYSSDFGKNWVDVSPANIGCNQVNDILFLNGQLLMTGCSLGGVFKLDKAAKTWARDFGFVFSYSNRFMKRDSVVFITAQDDIQRKYLPTGNWQQATGGLSQFYVYSHLNLNQNLFITTSVGVFKTEDYGNNWSDFNTGWSDPSAVYPVNIAVFGDTMFVGTGSKGVYKRAIPPNPISLPEVKGQNHNFRVFPNPAADHITISTTVEEKGTFKIYDQSGKLMMEGEYMDGAPLEIKMLKPGMYILQIKAGDAAFEQKLLIN